MSNEHVRNLTDLDLQVVTALPAAAANTTSDAIDLEQVVGGEIEHIAFEIAVPATPALTEAYAITIKVYDGAAANSLAVLDPLIQTTITGAAQAAGGAAKSIRFRLPPTARRFIAVNYAVASGGGNSTAVEATFRLLA